MNIVVEVLYTLLCVVYAYCEAAWRLLVPRSPKSVRDLVVLVTGGAKGIGRQTAFQLAARGTKIVLWDIDKEGIQSTADDLRATGAEVFSYVCDVSSYEDVSRTAAKVRRDVGDIDILINNAGLAICKPITELSEKEILKTMGVNTLSSFWTIKEFLPAMMTRKTGHVVMICSIAGIGGSSLMTDYTASKFAVRGLMDALYRELREQSLMGIKLTTVFPSFTNTALVDNVSDHAKIKLRFGQILQPDEVATAIVDGIIRNKHEVYIPGHGQLLPLLVGSLPWKARHILMDFIDMRFARSTE